MDKILKLLQKISPKDNELILEAINVLKRGQTELFNVKKLRGTANLFRIRKGNFRIIYEMKPSGDIKIVDLSVKGDGTYKKA